MILRQRSFAQHDQLDQMFRTVDISQRDGFALFASVHRTCFQAMSDRYPSGGHASEFLGQMVDCLSHDIRIIGATSLDATPELPKQIDPLAIDYLVAGSRMGSKVLLKRWAKSGDPRVQQACHYFGLQGDGQFWKDTCAALSLIAPSSARANEIVTDTQILFGLFIRVFETVSRPEKVA